MENIKIIENTQANGLEVYFNTKPNNNIITKLKNKNFRWHTAKKCWYTKKTAEALAFASSLANIDASIKPITASEEKADILALYKQQKDEYTARLQRYWNKYKNHITTYGYWANR